nr:unnamed protein product [Digitaria exilis]
MDLPPPAHEENANQGRPTVVMEFRVHVGGEFSVNPKGYLGGRTGTMTFVEPGTMDPKLLHERADMDRIVHQARGEMDSKLKLERENMLGRVKLQRRVLDQKLQHHRASMDKMLCEERENMDQMLKLERESMDRRLQQEREEMDRTIKMDRLSMDAEIMQERAQMDMKVLEERQEMDLKILLEDEENEEQEGTGSSEEHEKFIATVDDISNIGTQVEVPSVTANNLKRDRDSWGCNKTDVDQSEEGSSPPNKQHAEASCPAGTFGAAAWQLTDQENITGFGAERARSMGGVNGDARARGAVTTMDTVAARSGCVVTPMGKVGGDAWG